MDTNPRKQRQHFYRDYTSGQWSMSELCARYQASRPTGYNWIDRIEAEGLKAVDDRSRAPNRHPNQTPEHVEREILVLRERYGWGATKLREILKRRHPRRPVPAGSTINEILDRQGQLRKSRRRQSWKRLFREYGRPDAIRTDNGAPFVSTGKLTLCSSRT